MVETTTKGTTMAATKTQMAITSFTVLGESGIEYTIQLNAGGAPTCSCPAFAFGNGPCKHMNFVAGVIKTS